MSRHFAWKWGDGYTAYGYQVSVQNESFTGFNGEPRDTFLRWYFLGGGKRIYSPVLMRFLSVDMVSPFAEGGINCYAYCGGDPVNFTDPSGMVRWRNIVKNKVFPLARKNKPLPQSDYSPASKRRKLSASTEQGTSNNREASGVSPAAAPLVDSIWKNSEQRLAAQKKSAPELDTLGGLTDYEKMAALAIDTGRLNGSTRTYLDAAKGFAPERDPMVLTGLMHLYVHNVRKVESKQALNQILREFGL
ncbi:hypothetical protein CMV24_27345 [Pseudomonas plecoglossicida]|uniref:RHS repeat-associated core domain-containing protein n=1 Tax=Pseudomonas plecoglossicida TaxID=70775 RepID=A0A2A3LX11_PSEDL|nr:MULTISPECIES: RHS repeat-associated core domain-containing protein [Pseudomonas]MDY4311669.1 RHS repeat-associated core domain-containing protein [Pseudomonas putida]KAF4561081.1 RHS repeat-associated core domain-containing protein [Pseudomonas sp. CES]MBF8788037.1 RHS repeat-associated core domain-containing protein [Pseudomonas asiatica]MBF8806594.1 RHS repeat-associated core domain-containing protein [Pseudomonas asiatica]MBH3379413.1 RHS repeat-associated core domain-containing protein 